QPIINEEHVDNLRSMFPQRSQETITRALLLSDNDINRAVQFLLDHP
ncbi:35540_t:CDS:1, partial [Racocetra persica]